MRQTLPPELLQQIILEALWSESTPSQNKTEDIEISGKPPWSSIRSLTLASKTFRQLSLDAWFQTLFVTSAEQLKVGDRLFSELRAGWVRELHCVQQSRYMFASVWDLKGFKQLRSIRFDWAHPAGIDGPTSGFPFVNVPQTIVHLDIRCTEMSFHLVFAQIEEVFPNLKVLRLQMRRIWCSLCHTNAIARFRPPGPELIVYKGGIGLPLHYARVLSRLSHLHTVHITVPNFGTGSTQLGSKEGQNPTLWTGECNRCMEIMYEDAGFQDRWVATKTQHTPIGDKTKLRYQPPPVLEIVQWHFFEARLEDYPFLDDEGEFYDDDDEDGDDVDESD